MTTGLFARPADGATRHDALPKTKLRYIVIVSRDRPELFDEMTRRFRNSPDTSVVLEEDGPGDAHLWVAGYAIVRAS